MRPSKSLLFASAVALAAGLAAAPMPASAQALRLGALPTAATSAVNGSVEHVQWRGGPGGWRGGGGPGWNRGWRGGPGWRGGGPGWNGGWRGGPGWNGGWAGRPGWGPGWGRPGWGGPVYYGGWNGGWGGGWGPYDGWGPGFATGIIVGSAVGSASAPVYVAPGPVYAGQPSNWIAYCSAKYRSFDPRTGTFLGYDGRRHPCT